MSGGELFEKVADDSNRMTEAEAIEYTRQVCKALCHMHEMNYVHLDLKPENIMFTTKKSNELKLIDFGLASYLDPKDSVKVMCRFYTRLSLSIIPYCDSFVGFSYGYARNWLLDTIHVQTKGAVPYVRSCAFETTRHGQRLQRIKVVHVLLSHVWPTLQSSKHSCHRATTLLLTVA